MIEGGTIDTPNHPLYFSVNGNLEGFGTVNGEVSFSEANLLLTATDTLRINGNVWFFVGSIFSLEIGGRNQGNGYSYLPVSGTINFGGLYPYSYPDTFLGLSITNSFESQLKSTDTFTVAHANGGITGVLGGVPNGQRINADKASFQVNYGPGSPYGAGDLVLSKAIVGPTPPPQPGLTFAADAGIILPAFVATNHNVSQSIETANPSLGGRASYLFTVTNPGEYIVSANVNAPDDAHNSFFIDIDSEPTAPTMIWDIVRYTNGFQSRTACWRGNGTFDKPQFSPILFTLYTGIHELVIRGREVNTFLSTITILQVHRIKITKLKKNADGSFTINWPGQTAQTYNVERSSDGSNYTAIASGISGSDECTFTDSASSLAGVKNAFYRVDAESSP